MVVQQTPMHHHHHQQQQQQQKEIVGLLFFYHKADGTIKQLLPPFMHHFQISGKSLTLLNEALHFPEMMLINLMTFCPIE